MSEAGNESGQKTGSFRDSPRRPTSGNAIPSFNERRKSEALATFTTRGVTWESDAPPHKLIALSDQAERAPKQVTLSLGKVKIYGASEQEFYGIQSIFKKLPELYNIHEIHLVSDLGNIIAEGDFSKKPIRAIGADSKGRVILSKSLFKNLDQALSALTELISREKASQAQRDRESNERSLGKHKNYEARPGAEKGYFAQRPVIQEEALLNGGIYLPKGPYPTIVIDDRKSQVLNAIYREVIDRSPVGAQEFELLQQVWNTVRNRIPYHRTIDSNLMSRLAIGPTDKISIGAYVVERAGRFTHQALLITYILQRLYSNRKLKGLAFFEERSIGGNGTHAFVRYTLGNGNFVVFDPGSDYFGEVTEQNAWSYEKKLEPLNEKKRQAFQDEMVKSILKNNTLFPVAIGDLLKSNSILMLGLLDLHDFAKPTSASTLALRMLEDSLAELKRRGLTHLGVWENECLAPIINSERTDINAVLREKRSLFSAPDSVLLLIKKARALGLEIIPLRPNGADVDEFSVNQYNETTKFQFEQLNALKADAKVLVITSLMNLVPSSLAISNNSAAISLCARMRSHKKEGLVTLRFVMETDQNDLIRKRVCEAQTIREKFLPGDFLLVPNEYPVSSSQGNSIFALSPDFCVFQLGGSREIVPLPL